MAVELNHLRYFREVALSENISQAAKSLYITQPALSAIIKKLETELGYPLFIRKGNRIRLTEAGQCFLSYVNSVFSLLEEGIEKARALADQSGNQLRVLSGFHIVSYITEDYLSREPEARIKASTCPAGEIVAKLIRGEADIGVVLGHVRDIRLEERVLMTTRFYICVNREHPLAQKQVLHMADLEGQLLFCSNTAMTYEAATRLLQNAGVTCNLLMLDMHQVLFSAAEKGLGAVFCVPMMKTASEEAYGGYRLRFLPIMDGSEMAQLVLLRPKGSYHTEEQEKYLRYLGQWFAHNEELLHADLIRRMPM